MKDNHSAISPYFQNLLGNSEHFQRAIDGLLQKYQVQPVGVGYIDLIVEKKKSLALIHELSSLPVAVQSISWWCHSTVETKAKYGCPHGMGGPQNMYGEGRFSECEQYPIIDILALPSSMNSDAITHQAFSKHCNELAANYIANVLQTQSFYSPCLYPGLWLRVPEHWKRKYYLA